MKTLINITLYIGVMWILHVVGKNIRIAGPHLSYFLSMLLPGIFLIAAFAAGCCQMANDKMPAKKREALRKRAQHITQQ